MSESTFTIGSIVDVHEDGCLDGSTGTVVRIDSRPGRIVYSVEVTRSEYHGIPIYLFLEDSLSMHEEE